MGSIISKIITVGLLILSTLIGRSQNVSSDKVLGKYKNFKTRIESRLNDYRFMYAGRWDVFFDVYYHKKYSDEQSRFYKGVDLSLDGMVDSAMRKRIVTLLNDDYSEGEYDRWIDSLVARNKYVFKCREDAIEFTQEKKWNKCDVRHVITLCGGIKDDEIKSILINIYENKDNEIYDQYRKVSLKALARMGVEPYLSMFIEKLRYQESDEPEDMEKSIFELSSVPCKETMIEISRYMSSDKSVVSYSMADTIIGDTIYEEEEIEIVPIKIENHESDYQEYRDYIKTTAFYCLVRHILNPKLLSIVGEKRNKELFLYEMSLKLDAKLTPRKCKKIQRWMQKNYNNYDLTGNW